MNTPRPIAILGLLLITTSPLSSTCRANELRSMAAEVHQRTGNVGYQISVSHRRKPVLNEQFGSANMATHTPVTRDTQFLIMSITKAFTGAALVKAVESGRVAMDAPARRYLPGLRPLRDERRTVESLVVHTAGAPHRNHPERRALYDQHFDNAVLALAALERKRWQRPGRYRYSSGNYMVLAAIIEQATGMPFQQYVRETILGPLSLGDTGYQPLESFDGRLGLNYTLQDVWKNKTLDTVQLVPGFDYSYNMGGGGMVSTAADLVRFGEAFLAPGFFNARQLELIWNPILADHDSRWSYGWIVDADRHGRKRLLISGATIGVMGSLMVLPREQIVVAALVNCWCRDAKDAELIFGAPQRIVDAYLERGAP